MTQTLDVIIHSSVVTKVTVCIAWTMAALHELDVTRADILKANVTLPNRKKIWTVSDPEFGNDDYTV